MMRSGKFFFFILQFKTFVVHIRKKNFLIEKTNIFSFIYFFCILLYKIVELLPENIFHYSIENIIFEVLLLLLLLLFLNDWFYSLIDFGVCFWYDKTKKFFFSLSWRLSCFIVITQISIFFLLFCSKDNKKHHTFIASGIPFFDNIQCFFFVLS